MSNPHRAFGVVSAIILAATTAPHLLAQDQDQDRDHIQIQSPAPDQPPSRWTLSFEPSLWYVAPSGKMRLFSQSGASDKIELGDANMDSPRLSAFPEVNATDGEWGLSFRALDFGSTTRDWTAEATLELGDQTFTAGDAARTSMDLAVFELEGMYRAYSAAFEPRDEADGGGFRVRSDLDGIAGFRYYDLTMRFDRVAGGGVSETQHILEPVIGIKYTLELYEEVTIDARLTLGPGNLGSTGLSVDIQIGFQWNPTEHFGMQIGYRQLAYSLSAGGNDDFDYTGAMAGLYFGAVLRF